MVGVTGAGCRVSVMALVLGTGSGTVWHWFCHCSGTVPALPWPCTRPYMHSSTLGTCAPPDTTPAPCSPWVHPPGTRHPTSRTSTSEQHVHPRPDTPWGSLLDAPVARLARHVPWPVTRTHYYPLIGTPLHAPGVTWYRAITASRAIMTLLWSTLLLLAIMAN